MSGSFLTYPLARVDACAGTQDFFASRPWRTRGENSLIVGTRRRCSRPRSARWPRSAWCARNFPGKRLLLAVLISPMVVPGGHRRGRRLLLLRAARARPAAMLGLILAHTTLGGAVRRHHGRQRRCPASTASCCAPAANLGASPLTCFPPRDAAADPAGRALRRAVRVRRRRSTRSWSRCSSPGPPSARCRGRCSTGIREQHQPDHHRRRHAADPAIRVSHGDDGAAAPAQRTDARDQGMSRNGPPLMGETSGGGRCRTSLR